MAGDIAQTLKRWVAEYGGDVAVADHLALIAAKDDKSGFSPIEHDFRDVSFARAARLLDGGLQPVVGPRNAETSVSCDTSVLLIAFPFEPITASADAALIREMTDEITFSQGDPILSRSWNAVVTAWLAALQMDRTIRYFREDVAVPPDEEVAIVAKLHMALGECKSATPETAQPFVGSIAVSKRS